MTKPSWVARLPPGLREQTGWIFIGLMVTLVGLGYATGLTTSAVQQAIGGIGLRVWGGFLATSGTLVIWATLKQIAAHEKLALRLLACCLGAYACWLPIVVPWRNASMTIILSIVLIVLAEIRVGFLKLTLNYARKYADGSIE